jgi:hypothetical protein
VNEDQREKIAVSVKDLEALLIPLTSAQVLCAYYTLLSYARQRGDLRNDKEIFKDCLQDFRKVSQVLEQALVDLEPESLYFELKGISQKRSRHWRVAKGLGGVRL